MLSGIKGPATRNWKKTQGVYSYKLKPDKYYKKPRMIPLALREKLKKKGDHHEISRLERESPRQFGEFTRFGFKYDPSLVPFYDVPDLSNFELKPYVSRMTPKVGKDHLPEPIKEGTYKDPKLVIEELMAEIEAEEKARSLGSGMEDQKVDGETAHKTQDI
mmetsp:Transcript_37615/g.42637  ORF Transcript_37615/g.42637 Transcript_37615/m.42637 type:complete len:161 (+) Transcript_37615:46-528(+)